MGSFNQRFEAFISPRWSPGLRGLLRSPQFVLVYLCTSVGPLGATRRSACLFFPTLSPALWVYLCECGAAGSASGQTACPVRPTLRQSRSRHGHASPLCPGCPSLPLLPVWMNVCFLFPWCQTSLPFYFLSVLVVRGGAVCPPTLSSWFSQMCFLIVKLLYRCCETCVREPQMHVIH